MYALHLDSRSSLGTSMTVTGYISRKVPKKAEDADTSVSVDAEPESPTWPGLPPTPNKARYAASVVSAGSVIEGCSQTVTAHPDCTGQAVTVNPDVSCRAPRAPARAAAAAGVCSAHWD